MAGALGREAGERAGGRPRTGRRRRRARSRTATGSAVRNVQRALRPGRALSRRARPGRSRSASATSIGRTRGELRQRLEPDERGRRRRGNGRPRRGSPGDDRRRDGRTGDERAVGGTDGGATCARGISGSSSVAAGPGRPTRSPTSPASASATRRSIRGDGPLVVGEGPVRTGVTMVVPHDGDIWTEPVYAGSHRLNGNGELTGLEWIREAGLLTGPIGITNTHCVGVVRDGIIRNAVRRLPFGTSYWALPVVGRDVGRPAQRHRRLPRDGRPRRRGAGGGVRRAGRARATSAAGPGWSATSSRAGSGPRRGSSTRRRAAARSACSSRRTTAGASWLRVDGVPVGEAIPVDGGAEPVCGDRGRRRAAGRAAAPARARSSSIVATDAPLLPHQCERLAQRAGLGIARMGGTGAHSSGDLFLCFATGNRALPRTSFRADPRRRRRRPGAERLRDRRRCSTRRSRRPRRRSSTRSSRPRR